MASKTNKKFNSVMTDVTGYLTIKQMEDMFNAAVSKRDKLLILLLMKTGRRISEIIGRDEYILKNVYRVDRNKAGKVVLDSDGVPKTINVDIVMDKIAGLKPSDIQWENKSIAFNILKKRGNLRALKGVDDDILEHLKDYIEEYSIAEDEPIFDLSRFQAYRIIRKAGRAVGIIKVGNTLLHPHHFRHSFCANIAMNTNSVEDFRLLQQYMDHSSMDMTAHYMQFSQEKARGLISKTFK